MIPRLRSRRQLTLPLVALPLLLVACATAAPETTASPANAASTEKSGKAPAEDPDIVKITLIGTNDLHGWLEPHEAERRGDEPVLGGVSAFAGYVSILREQRPDGVVLVDAGDLFQGTLVANMTEGSAVIKAYNSLRYDAAAVGNHEFDYGPEGDSNVARTPSEDPLGALKKRMAEAKFPFLTGNIFLKDTKEPVAWPNTQRSVLIRRHGLNIGIIGLSTPTTPAVTLGQNVASLDFKPLAATTLELATDLRARGAQIIIVTMHAGGSCPRSNEAHDLTGCNGGEVVPFLRELPPGTVDAVVAGHTHQFIANFISGVPVIESKSYSEAFGVVELAFNTKTGKVDQSLTNIWPSVSICRLVHQDTNSCRKGSGPFVVPTFLGSKVVPDSTIDTILGPDLQRVAQRKSEKLGPRLQLGFGRSREEESDLGNLIADVLKSSVANGQIGVVNSGGIRADLEPGDLTYGRIFNALPFENRLATMQLTGAELLALISRGFEGVHGILQISGIRVQALKPGAKPCEEGGSRVVSAVLESGGPIVPTDTYTVVTNDFVAGGGDDFDAVLNQVDPSRIQIRYDLPPVREELVAFVRFHPEMNKPLRPPKPRVSFVEPKCKNVQPAASAQ
jgi:5'-nucleotidase